MNREIVHMTLPSRVICRQPNVFRYVDKCSLEDCPINHNHYKGVFNWYAS